MVFILIEVCSFCVLMTGSTYEEIAAKFFIVIVITQLDDLFYLLYAETEYKPILASHKFLPIQ